jgi:glucose-1-phosphatase
MKALLFDIGNVLVRFDFAPCLERLAARSPLAKGQIMPVLGPLKDALECGQMSDASFVTQSMTALRYTGTPVQFKQAWCEIFTSHAPMLETLRRLRLELPCYLLSNTNGLHKDYLLEQYEVFGFFQDGIYSHEARCMKPAAGIYEQAVERFGLDPAQTFYVDDLLVNIEAGQQLGFHSFHYDPERHEELDCALERWLEK